MPTKTKIDVVDFRGEVIRVLYTDNYSRGKFRDCQFAVKTWVSMPCGDIHAAWMPVFTEWF